MKTIFLTYTKNGLTEKSLIKHPPEDSYKISGKYPIAAVADGVTLLKHNPDGRYPLIEKNLSGPKKIAEFFSHSAVNYLEKKYSSFNQNDLNHSFICGNNLAKKFNERYFNISVKNKRYGEYSFAAVAALALIIKRQLFYGFITDCGIAIISKNNKVKFLSRDVWSRRTKFIPRDIKKIKEKSENVADNYNKIRNNPQLIKNKKFYTYGVINGQSTALRFFETGTKNLSLGDSILIFTDGFRNYFNHKKFVNIISQAKNSQTLKKQLDNLEQNLNKKNSSKFSDERTLVILKANLN